MTERRLTTLGALGKIVIGSTPPGDDPTHFDGPVPFVTPADLDGRRIVDSAARSLTEQGAGLIGAARAPRGCVLLVCIGADLGRTACAGIDTAINQQLAAIIVEPPNSARYVYYDLRARRRELRAAAGGSAQPILTKSTLLRTPIVLPAPPRQRAIVDALGALDDKVELNERLSLTLAEIARARFRAQFVDLPGGPGRDWKVVRLGDLFDLEKGLSYRGELLGDAGPRLLGLGQFAPRPELGFDELPRRYGGRHRERHLVRAGDLMIANTDLTQRRELIGIPLRVPELGEGPLLFTHHVYAVRFHRGCEDWRDFVFFALQQPEFRARAAGFAAGTTVLSLPRDAVLDHAIALPPPRLRAAFARVTRPLLARIDHARHESRALAELRDHLLPGLVSGALVPPRVGGRPAVP
ncbi:restriction endonuclease subunit S [Nannocystis sp. SCPEA4]|uniref:restriction endonuclease subunit S n=1 Tax=Nannocystis sp. SCPEA4 TaxID=2996787 RepID=UPI00226FCE1C|nr:restriction endonuclease subunit S [Nannocystis sp. SCPEA4]MCY1060510.1 restriction endonuclease subunit S [Nannocystis sp. SCPEA4]